MPAHKRDASHHGCRKGEESPEAERMKCRACPEIGSADECLAQIESVDHQHLRRGFRPENGQKRRKQRESSINPAVSVQKPGKGHHQIHQELYREAPNGAVDRIGIVITCEDTRQRIDDVESDVAQIAPCVMIVEIFPERERC